MSDCISAISQELRYMLVFFFCYVELHTFLIKLTQTQLSSFVKQNSQTLSVMPQWKLHYAFLYQWKDALPYNYEI